MKLSIAVFTVASLLLAGEVSSHGRLMEPPARNAMWRYGYPNPVNYNDNELYCGGFVVHYQKNKGKCGVCGDDYKEKMPRPHEAGGLFGNGIIVRRYVMGQVIEITAELTTNHKGWMELKLCSSNNPKKIITQECLDMHPLQLVTGPGEGHKFIIPQNSTKIETFKYSVKLPDYLTCSHCVIQWTYFAGNTWGLCNDGSESVGCGEQETFINCADVEIYSNTAQVPANLVDNPWGLFFRVWEKSPNGNDVSYSLRPLVVRSQLCIPTQRYANVTGMMDWCRVNCLRYPPNCHPDVCKCVSECKAIGSFAQLPEADVYCHQNCLGHPSVCPADRCECF